MADIREGLSFNELGRTAFFDRSANRLHLSKEIITRTFRELYVQVSGIERIPATFKKVLGGAENGGAHP